MAAPRQPPPPAVLNHPRFCPGAGNALLFRLRPGVTEEAMMAAFREAYAGTRTPVGLTSYRTLRFDDGTYLHRTTYVSVAAWKRNAADVKQMDIFARAIESTMQFDESDMWMGMYTLIPARFAPDLDLPSVPRPVNPCEIEHQQQQASASAAADAAATSTGNDDQAVSEGSIVSGANGGVPSFVSLPVGGGGATDRRQARRLPSIGTSVRCGSAASSILFARSTGGESVAAHPPSAAYTEARSSAGLSPDDRESPYGAAGYHGDVNFASYWRSAAWAAPALPQAPRGIPDPYFSPANPLRPARTKLKAMPGEMVHHIPESCYTIILPRAGPLEEGPPDEPVTPGFTILIDGDPTVYFRQPISQPCFVYRPPAPRKPNSPLPKLLHKPLPPTASALAPVRHTRKDSSGGNSSDHHNRGATRGSTPTSVACTAGDDEAALPDATVASSLSSYSNAATSKAATSKTASTTGVPSRGSRGVGGKNKAPVLCVLVAFTDDKKKKKCRLDTGVCPEPQPGQTVRVRDGVAPDRSGGRDAKLRAAKVLTVTPWSTRKGGSSSGSVAALPAVVGIAQV